MRLMVMAAAMVLAGCGGDVRDTKIADIDFTNIGQVDQVAQKLPAPERDAFGRYARSRVMGKEIRRADGNDPVTVAEAIKLGREQLEKDKVDPDLKH